MSRYPADADRSEPRLLFANGGHELGKRLNLGEIGAIDPVHGCFTVSLDLYDPGSSKGCHFECQGQGMQLGFVVAAAMLERQRFLGEFTIRRKQDNANPHLSRVGC